MPGPNTRMKVTVMTTAAAIQGQLLRIGIGDASGQMGGCSDPPLASSVPIEGAEELPPKVEAAADRGD